MAWTQWIQQVGPQVGPIAQKLVRGYCRIIGRPLVEVEYDCGFGNQLYLRGDLPGLSWEKGVAMHNLGSNCWIWMAPTPCRGPFKALINDLLYEEGPNHQLDAVEGLKILPNFNLQDRIDE